MDDKNGIIEVTQGETQWTATRLPTSSATETKSLGLPLAL